MPGFKSIGQLIDAELEGKTRTYSFRKNSSVAYQQSLWADISSSSGNPVAKYWFDATPLVAKAVYQSTDGGIFHGAGVSPSNKYLRRLYINGSTSVTSCTLILMDYLLYYPTIDESTTDEQFLDNTITLPRYTDGEGVQVIALSVANRTGLQYFTINYTNQDGVSGRVSSPCYQSTLASNNVLLTSGATGGSLTISALPFVGLQGDDTGVRSIESVTMNGVDTGLFSLILVKPLCTISFLQNSQSPTEIDFLLHKGSMPIIKDDAFISFIYNTSNSSTHNFFGDLTVSWD